MRKGFLKDAIYMITGNLFSLFISVFSAFIIPIILSTSEYGSYKLFILYSTYVPFLHFGFVDGIFLKKSGKKLSFLSNGIFRSYSKFFVLFESILSIIIIIFSMIYLNPSAYRFIVINVFIYSFLFNLLTYFQFIAKSVMNFQYISFTTRIQSYFNFSYLVVAYFLYKFNFHLLSYKFFIVFTNVMILIVLCMYVVKYHELLFGTSRKIIKEIKNIELIFKSGFLLTISYQISLFMINSDNQFISYFFSVGTFGQYSFAYSLASILVTVLNAVSSILLPYMKKKGKSTVIKNFEYNVSITSIVIFAFLIFYYPIVILVHTFFVKYLNSIFYLKIIFSGVAITCIVDSIIFNTFIMLRKLKAFCFISIGVIVITFSNYYIVNLISHSPQVVAVASIPCLLLWLLILNVYLKNVYKIAYIKNYLYVVIMSLLFISINQEFNLVMEFIIYLIFFVVITYLFFINDINKIICKNNKI